MKKLIVKPEFLNEYGELKDQAIKKLKRQVDWTCQRCGISKVDNYFIQIHYKDGHRFNVNPKNLMIVCRNCQHELHWGKEGLSRKALKIEAAIREFERNHPL